MDGTSYRKYFIALLALALGMRLIASLWWQFRLPEHVPFFFPDSESYWELAHTIANRQPYTFGDDAAKIFRMPGYSLLLSPLFLVWQEPSPLLARGISALCGTISVAIVMLLTRDLFSSQAALLAGLFAAVDPGTVSQGVFVLSEAPFCPLLVGQLWCMVRSMQANNLTKSISWALAAGLLAALATYMRPSWLLFVPFAATIALLCWQQRPKYGMLIVCCLLTLCFGMMPWWYRNYQLTGKFIPTTLQVGASLYDGLNPHADGSSNMPFVANFREQLRYAQAELEPTSIAFEQQLDANMKTAAIVWAKEHPQRVAQLAITKYLRLWTPWPNARDIGGFWPKLAVALGYVPVLLLACLAVRKFVNHTTTWLLILPAFYFTFLHCVFVSSVRYRQPAMLPLIVLAAGYVSQWKSLYRFYCPTVHRK
jgi:4-amino-4-deoxy-L-arabinose transferase-like glycosyltransferase